jgi:hypothetical protein
MEDKAWIYFYGVVVGEKITFFGDELEARDY